MTRWSTGEALVEQLLQSGQLQTVTGGAASGDAWLLKAERTLETARRISDQDPDSAIVLAYDSARSAVAGTNSSIRSARGTFLTAAKPRAP